MTTRHLAVRLHAAAARVLHRSARRAERGDVPGWVLITLMTAGLVSVLWVVAQDQLVALFREALASVRN
ncbi:hypothetical protein [Oryzobacter telluris]|uniref:hypothetical protein n=1 Tax=Oryzobacter telluris TaxID=3149179 RepID=UPI00370D0B2F